MTKEALTPGEKKAKLRERLAIVLSLLPEKWINLFMHLHPEYKDQMVFLNNVRGGKSLDEDVIEKMEEIAKTLQTIKK
jgi:hypothetical protein